MWFLPDRRTVRKPHPGKHEKEIDRIFSLCKKHALDTVITTEKDAVKLKNMLSDNSLKFLSLKMEISFIKNETEFVNRLLGIYSR